TLPDHPRPAARGGSLTKATQRLASDAGGLASLAEPLQLLAAAALTGLLVVGLTPHLFTQSTSFAELAKTTDRFLNRFAGPNPYLHHRQHLHFRRSTRPRSRPRARRSGRVRANLQV